MKHKCDGCQYKGDHREMMFRPFGVCLKATDLVKAEADFNAEVCPHKKTDQMTEAEIMKALEICSQNDTNKHYMMTYHGMPLHILFEAIVDLINRKNAEIERLERSKSISQHLLTDAWERIEHLDKLNALARSEAIKEFAEKVKRKAITHFPLCNVKEVYSSVRVKYIDQIAKEMGVE